MSSPLVSVILSTYNRPDALRLVLGGYVHVESPAFEVIVADDGSGPETAAAVDRFASTVNFRVHHVRQDDDGFRLAAIRNLAVRAARGRVLVFTDGDCVPFPSTLGVHASRCAPGRAVAGERCGLDEEETADVLAAQVISADLFERTYQRERGRLSRLAWKNLFYRATRSKPRPKLGTCNAAVHRDDFERVNGFDERFVGWGYEDEDLARRLRHAGVRIVDAVRQSLVLHLFHKVHESHRPNARSSPNYHYFKTGRYLTRPLRGLQSRSLDSLSLELLGAVPDALRGEASKTTVAPEVSLVFGAPNLATKPRGEVVVQVSDAASASSLEGVYRLLADALSGDA